MHRSRHPVVVLGASAKRSRYSNQAVRLLQAEGYEVIPVHPRAERIEGLAVAPSLGAVQGPVDTLTLYVGERRLLPLADQVVALRPGRVIFNPGTESEELQARLDREGIAWVRACTLVMLRSGRF